MLEFRLGHDEQDRPAGRMPRPMSSVTSTAGSISSTV